MSAKQHEDAIEERLIIRAYLIQIIDSRACRREARSNFEYALFIERLGNHTEVPEEKPRFYFQCESGPQNVKQKIKKNPFF